MKIFSDNLKTLRSFYGYTQERLAKLLSLEQRTILSYETGDRIPTIKTLLNLAEIYDISFDFLILNENCLYPKNLKLLKLAKAVDRNTSSKEKECLKEVILLLGNKNLKAAVSAKEDRPEIALRPSFHENLKDLRIHRKMTQPELGEVIGVARTSVAQYEAASFPPLEKLVSLSKIFNLSIHALVSGELLHFNFDDSQFGDMILKADHFLSLEDHNVLIRLMEAILKK